MEKFTWCAIALWLSGWLFATRHAMLDDCLIHLRYAVNLRTFHEVTYDGLHANFGTSSLVYLAVLSVLSSVSGSPLLPKVLSDGLYVLLIVLMTRKALSLRTGSVSRKLSFGLLTCMLAPMGIRWLSDGMETGLVLVLMVCLAAVTGHLMDCRSLPGWKYFLLALFGALVVLTRIELASQIALVSIIVLIGNLQFRSSMVKAAWVASPLALGALVAMLWIDLHFHTLLPDTALAKSGPRSIDVVLSIGHVLASSVMLGIGLFSLWIGSAILLLRQILRGPAARQKVLLWLAGNAGFPVLVLLAYLRGQAIQGVRYVLWALIFSLLWNIRELERTERQLSGRSMLSQRGLQWTAAAGGLVLLLMLPVDWFFGWRAMAGRSETFNELRVANFAGFAGRTVIAGDVGFIGYFSRGDVCDIDGLVNGREAARTSPEQRIARCAAQHPKMLFLTSPQTAAFVGVLDLKQWTVCKHFDFDNVLEVDRHYLMVRAENAQKECPAIGGEAGIAASQVPGLED